MRLVIDSTCRPVSNLITSPITNAQITYSGLNYPYYLDKVGSMSDDKYFINPVESSYQGHCPHCNHTLYNVLPIQPVFAVKDAFNFIPMPYKTFKNWLSKHRDKLSTPHLYRRDTHKRIHRYLTASDLRIIRDYTFSTRLPNKKYKRIYELYETLSDETRQDANE